MFKDTRQIRVTSLPGSGRPSAWGGPGRLSRGRKLRADGVVAVPNPRTRAQVRVRQTRVTRRTAGRDQGRARSRPARVTSSSLTHGVLRGGAAGAGSCDVIDVTWLGAQETTATSETSGSRQGHACASARPSPRHGGGARRASLSSRAGITPRALGPRRQRSHPGLRLRRRRCC